MLPHFNVLIHLKYEDGAATKGAICNSQYYTMHIILYVSGKFGQTYVAVAEYVITSLRRGMLSEQMRSHNLGGMEKACFNRQQRHSEYL